MTIEIEKTTGRFGLSENGKDILARFVSILLTALISALITFLQSILADPSLSEGVRESIPQAGALGAILRAGVLAWRSDGMMKG